MLGILSIIALVAGAFVAGGGAFDWEFLFSDGYREHNWVRNLGRGGARGLLMLLGSVLVVVGFIGQVVDSAAKPVVTTRGQETFDTARETSPSGGSSNSSTETGQTHAHHPASGKTAPSSGSSVSPATADSAPPPAAAGGKQPMTVWNPQLEFGEGETMIRLQYRFETGYEPIAGAEYVWLIDVPAKPTEVPYDTLQKQGRLEYILRLPQPEKTLSESWTMFLMVENKGKRTQVSNRLDIAGGRVRSTPLEPPRLR